ncbi:hypothetical protein SAMN05443668_105376 [Cryptosporangium aurantiacum]|uniref:Uncharacterized protein n=1 Tax=Cryptosporangium aurantiacum TaxID=134849 RepID=A0A1M7QU16_9ACTN|nr:hypothetical protein SAMN05443668_105376 [Cryptosporangium aurantiacum]
MHRPQRGTSPLGPPFGSEYHLRWYSAATSFAVLDSLLLDAYGAGSTIARLGDK